MQECKVLRLILYPPTPSFSMKGRDSESLGPSPQLSFVARTKLNPD